MFVSLLEIQYKSVFDWQLTHQQGITFLFLFCFVSFFKKKETKQKQTSKKTHTDCWNCVGHKNKSVSNTVWCVQLWFGLISGHLNAHQTCKLWIHSLSVTLCNPCKTSGAFTLFTWSFRYLWVLYQLILTTLCARQNSTSTVKNKLKAGQIKTIYYYY